MTAVPTTRAPHAGHGPPDQGPSEAPVRQRRRRGRKILIGLLVVVVLAAAGGTAFVLGLQARLEGQIQRIDGVFSGLEKRPDRPASGPAAAALNILVMGTDRRAEESATGSSGEGAEWVPGAQRTDTIMILHIDGDREGASLISIPRDSWVDVPGHGFAKINAAFSLAGPSLAVETVEQLTGLRIDHLAVVDMVGFQALTDAIGGVTITVPNTVVDTHNDVVWTKGQHRLDGEAAMLYVRQRYGLPGGDFDRVRRQQAFVRSVVRSSVQTLRDGGPRTIYNVLDTLTQHVSLDSEWEFGDLRGLVFGLRELSAADIDFLTVPVLGTGMEGAQSVVYLDRPANHGLWQAVRNDSMDGWLSTNTTANVLEGPAP
jgi:LCP family protein required for cell wall assembly